MREPDVLCVLPEHGDLWKEEFAGGADLVIEVVSPSDPKRDTVVKRQEYARAGIREYWIADPMAEAITVLTLAGDAYEEHGVFAPGQRATSRLLQGFGVDVTEALAGA